MKKVKRWCLPLSFLLFTGLAPAETKTDPQAAITEFRKVGQDVLNELHAKGVYQVDEVSLAELQNRLDSVRIETTTARLRLVNPRTGRETAVDAINFPRENRILLSLAEWSRHDQNQSNAKRWIVIHELIELRSKAIDDPDYQTSYFWLKHLSPHFRFLELNDFDSETLAAIQKACAYEKRELFSELQTDWNAFQNSTIREDVRKLQKKLREEIASNRLQAQVDNLSDRHRQYESESNDGDFDRKILKILAEDLNNEFKVSLIDRQNRIWEEDAIVRCDPISIKKEDRRRTFSTQRVLKKEALVRPALAIESENVVMDPTAPECRHVKDNGLWRKSTRRYGTSSVANRWEQFFAFQILPPFDPSSPYNLGITLVSYTTSERYHHYPQYVSATPDEATKFVIEARITPYAEMDFGLAVSKGDLELKGREAIRFVEAETLEDVVKKEIERPCRYLYGWDKE